MVSKERSNKINIEYEYQNIEDNLPKCVEQSELFTAEANVDNQSKTKTATWERIFTG